MMVSQLFHWFCLNHFFSIDTSAAKQPKKGRSADKAPASASKTTKGAGKKTKAT